MEEDLIVSLEDKKNVGGIILVQTMNQKNIFGILHILVVIDLQ